VYAEWPTDDGSAGDVPAMVVAVPVPAVTASVDRVVPAMRAR
jgi:hypothetical protein